ncbi:MAG: DUF1702 family protein, partial [Phycisphaerae bacterium]
MHIAVQVGLLAGLVGVLVLTGRWRLCYWPFRLRPSRMTVGKLGFLVSCPENVRRVESITRSFAGGFNAALTSPSDDAWRRRCDSFGVHDRPFAHEGAAMGYPLRRLGGKSGRDFEESVVSRRPEMRYLYYVGLGFWSGMRNHTPERMRRVVEGLDPLYRFLCYDGYGFKVGFFDYLKDRACITRLDRFEGYARHAAYQGLGRAFWFLFMDRHDLLIERIGELGDDAVDAAAGVGLATAFVNTDRLEVAFEVGLKMPGPWRDHFHQGMCFALKARSLDDVDEFDKNLSRLPSGSREAAYAAIRECDRVELLIRDEQADDGYRRWRDQVRRWMADNVEYP